MFEIYKSTAALNARLIPPTINPTKGFLEKKGAAYIEMTDGKNKSYNWKDKVVFAISPSDMPAVMEFYFNLLKTGNSILKLIHDPNMGSENAGQKYTSFEINADIPKKSIFINMSSKSKSTDESRRFGIAVTLGELLLFKEFLNAVYLRSIAL
jgi:hypothetical protein